MFILRGLKGLLLTIILLVFVITGVVFQANLLLSNTVFSGSYFTRACERADLAGHVPTLLNESVGGLLGNAMSQKEVATLVDAGAVWIKGEILPAIQGVYGFAVNDRDRLPTINIRPVKDAFLTTFVDEIMKNAGDSQAEVQALIGSIKASARKYPADISSDQVLDEVMRLPVVVSTGMSRQSVSNVIQKVLAMDEEHLQSADIAQYAVKQIMTEKVGLDKIKDELDLHLLCETVFGSDSNPVFGAVDLLAAVRSKLLLIVVGLPVALLLIAGLVLGNFRSAVRWLGGGLLLTGIAGMVPYAFAGRAEALLEQQFARALSQNQAMDLTFLHDLVFSYFGGIWTMLLIPALLLSVLGIVLLLPATGKWLTRTSSPESQPKSRVGQVLLRTLAVLCLLVAIPVGVLSGVSSIRTQVEEFERTTRSAQKANVAEALAEVLNAGDLLKMMGK